MFAGRVKIVSHLSCRTSAIFKYFCPLSMKPDINSLVNCVDPGSTLFSRQHLSFKKMKYQIVLTSFILLQGQINITFYFVLKLILALLTKAATDYHIKEYFLFFYEGKVVFSYFSTKIYAMDMHHVIVLLNIQSMF